MHPGEVLVMVPSGMLGSGIALEHVQRGIAQGADVIALDSGSTDSGPAYLARAVSKSSRESIRNDLQILIEQAHSAGIPLLIGSCGTSGTDTGVDWTADIASEVASSLGIKPRIALLYSEQGQPSIKAKNAAGKVRPLSPAAPLTDAMVDACEHIVALMGPEPYMEAVRRGAQIVLGGRTTDTAVLAAVPLIRGAGAGPAWHAAKIAECGGQCTVDPRSGGVLIRVGRTAFDVEPLEPTNRCTPASVSAHMLYETANPFCLTEPGGTLDVTQALYSELDERVTRVTGSIWRPGPYTMKLEGAAGGPYQTVMLVGIRDPEVLMRLDEFATRMQAAMVDRIRRAFGDEAGEFDVSLRIYGWNAVSGSPVPAGAAPPREVGVLFVVTASTQSIADAMAKSCNPYLLHFPVLPGTELPSYAFPFSPAEISRGRVSEFLLNHIVEVSDGHELVRTRWLNLPEGAAEAPTHA
jgi:hypothetical protein